MERSRKVGGILTSGLLALALALALLQAAILANTGRASTGVSSSAPGAQPWTPPAPRPPSEREGRTPDPKPPREQHRSPLRAPGVIPQTGPRAPRKAVA
jgi:hypothetical protein